jgi:hypothetical protein
LPHKICARHNSCVTGCRLNGDCKTGEICTLEECVSPRACDLKGGNSPCSGNNRQIAFLPGTFTQDQCDVACREVSTHCQSFAISAVGGAYGCYLYNQDVSKCGGNPGASNWAYSDRNCHNSWKSPACRLEGGATKCSATAVQIAAISGTFTAAQCGEECKAAVNCRSFAIATSGGPHGCHLYSQGVAVCHGEPGARDWSYFDHDCPVGI